MEAATGLEPVNNGFAIRRLSHLAMPPQGTEQSTAPEPGVKRTPNASEPPFPGAPDSLWRRGAETS